MKAVIINSGGMDSTTLVYQAVNEGYDVTTLSFDYGQRHVRELNYAHMTARRLGLPWRRVNMHFLAELFSSLGSKSSLVSQSEVPEGHYAAENMAQTVVPNRNMIMLSIAAGVAVSMEADVVMAGMHAGDHFIYPDCRPRFTRALNAAMVLGNEGFGAIPAQPEEVELLSFLVTPFIHLTKQEIAETAIRFDVDFSTTWSCYKGEQYHCGRCGTCVERLEAIHGAVKKLDPESYAKHGILAYDSTHYEDPNYWLDVIAYEGAGA